MNFFKRNWFKLVLLSYSFLVPFFMLYAQETECDPAKGMICNPIPTIKSIPDLIQTVLTGALRIGIPVVALAIIYSGFLFVFARGNSEKLTKAKDTLLYTLIGAAVLLGSWAIAKMIAETVKAL